MRNLPGCRFACSPAKLALGEPFKKVWHPMLRMSRKNKESDQPDQRVDVIYDGSQTLIAMTVWQKRDWQQFYELARRPWRRHRPPRPVYPSGLNRVAPAQGYSLSELDDAGVDLDLAERLGLPVDAGRIGVYGPNVTVLREFIRSSRHPL
jgi:ribosomal protein L13E